MLTKIDDDNNKKRWIAEYYDTRDADMLELAEKILDKDPYFNYDLGLSALLGRHIDEDDGGGDNADDDN